MALTTADVEAIIGSDLWNELAALVNGTTPPVGKTASPLKPVQLNSSSVYALTVGNQDTANGLIQKWQYGPVDAPTTVATLTKDGFSSTNLTFSGPRPWADLTAYSADPTGAAASDTAIANWLAAGSGGYCYAPAGTYLVGAGHVVPPNTRIVCAGMGVTTFKRKSTFTGATDYLFTLGDDCELHDCTIDGNSSDGDGNGQITGGSLSAAITCEVWMKGDRVTLHAVEFVQPSGYFCVVSGSTGVSGRDNLIEHCVFTGNNEATVGDTFHNTSAIQQGGAGSENLRVVRNRFTNFNWGIMTIGLGGEFSGNYCYNNHIAAQTGASLAPGTHLGVGGIAGAGARVIGNYFAGTPTRATGGMEVRQGSGGTVVSSNVVVGGATVGAGTTGAGIFVADDVGTDIRHVTVSDNVVIGWTGPGIAIGSSTSGDIDDCTVTGNVCYLNGSSGIQLNTNRTVVVGNQCVDNGAYASAADRAGIWAAAGAAWFVLVGNHCFDNGPVTQQWGIQVAAGGGDQYVIAGNVLQGNVNAAGLSDGGSGTGKQVFGNVPTTAPTTLNLGGWTTFTPTLTQVGSLTLSGSSYAKYMVVNKTAFVQVQAIVASGTGTAGNDITLGGIPAAIAMTRTGLTALMGGCLVQDSGSNLWVGQAFATTTTAVKCYAGSSTTGQAIGTSPSFGLAVNDVVSVALAYEIA